MKERAPFLRSVSIVSFLTLGSRVLGMLRDMTISYFVGTGAEGDAFVAAIRIPNMFRRLMGEGAMTAAFVPSFSAMAVREDRRRLWDFADRFFWTFAVVLGVFVGLGVAFSPAVIHAVAPGFAAQGAALDGGGSLLDLTVLLNRIAFPYLFFVCLAAVLMGVLNTMGSFGLPAATPIVLNVTIIAVAWGVAPHVRHPSVALAAGFTLGGVLQLLMQAPACRRLGMRFRPVVDFRDPDVRGVARLMGPGVFGAGIYQINLIVGTMVASILPRGSMVALYYADRLNELVLGGFAVSVATVILPTLSKLGAGQRTGEMRETLAFGLRFVFFITIPAALGLSLLREGIVRAVFRRGQFDETSVDLTAGALLWYTVGLSFVAGARVLTSAFYARKDLRTPVYVSALVFALNLLFLGLLVPPMEHRGIALASSLSQTGNFLLLAWLFRRQHGRLLGRQIAASAGRTLLASLPMAALCVAAAWWFGDGLGRGLAGILELALVIGAALGVYGGAAHVVGCTEFREIVSMFRDRVGRRGGA